MIDFMAQYTLDQFIVYTVAFIGVVVLCVKTFDYFNDRFHWLDTKRTRRTKVMDEMNDKLSILLEQDKKQQEMINALVKSDQSRIRAEITKEWQERSEKKEIDYLTLDYLRKQYDCYKAEGGNSHITKMMEDIDTWKIINS